MSCAFFNQVSLPTIALIFLRKLLKASVMNMIMAIYGFAYPRDIHNEFQCKQQSESTANCVILYNAQSQLSLGWKQTKWIQRNK